MAPFPAQRHGIGQVREPDLADFSAPRLLRITRTVRRQSRKIESCTVQGFLMANLKKIATDATIAGALALTALGLGTGVANADPPSPHPAVMTSKLDGFALDNWGGPGWGGGGPGYGYGGAPGYGYGGGPGYGYGGGPGYGYGGGCAWVPPVVSVWIPPAVCGG
jgi:hypothetical protein